MADYYIRLIKLPFSVKGVTTPNDDGSYNIYINERIPDHQKRDALNHELAHVDNDDFYSERYAHEIEKER